MGSRILKYHTSRFRFRASYLASILLVSAGALVYYQDYPWYVYSALFVFAVIVIAINETKIRSNCVTLKSDSVVLEIGTLSKKTKKVSYHNISEIDVKQSFFQRVCGHGDIEIGVLGSNVQHNISHHFSGKGDVKIGPAANAPHGIILRNFQNVKGIETAILARMESRAGHHPHSLK